MQIKTITANNFKSLVDFKVDLPKFSCLIGLNGAGKSTLLQFIDFVSQQMRGNLKEWLEERQWKASELNSRFSSRKNIDFSVSLVTETDGPLIRWRGSFNTNQLRCSTEEIITRDAYLRVDEGRLNIGKRSGAPDREVFVSERTEGISFRYEGSILSQLTLRNLSHSFAEVQDYFARVKSLDLLAPQYLRQRSRESEGSLGLGGQKLSAFVFEMGPQGRRKLTSALRHVYHHLESVEASPQQYGWKQLRIAEHFQGQRIETEARHVSDGMLRLVAILAELQSNHPLLLFDEIENGINPELVEFVINSLVQAPQQVIATTHSPLILNYLDDEVARKGVLYVYRRPDGLTRCIPFFSIPSLAEKLTVMGPGEAFADTNLLELADEINEMPKV